MAVYHAFARFYAQGPYVQFSRHMAELLPAVLERFGFRPAKILDIACGEGTFAVAMAQQGFEVTAVDLSAPMLEQARAHAGREQVEFLQHDMRGLPFSEQFDLVTCWYDSLNYLLEMDDLLRTFAGVHRALREGGLFIFDMNTIYGLAVQWQRQPCYVQQDTPTLFEIHRPSYDYERNLAAVKITGFAREGETWVRSEEIHRERGYTLDEIRRCFHQAGWQELCCWGNLREMTEPHPDSGRVWFVLKKGMTHG